MTTVPQLPTRAEDVPVVPGDFMATSRALRSRCNCSMTDAMRTVVRLRPDLHRAFVEGIKPVKLSEALADSPESAVRRLGS